MRLAALAVVAALGLPSGALAEDTPEPPDEGPRLLVGLEGAVWFPVTDPQLRLYWPGATGSLAAHVSLTKYLMPIARMRMGFLADAPPPGPPDDDPSAAYLSSFALGLRFRPRGIAHPEEASRASCIWAEVAAALAFYGGDVRPSFEGAIGFGFVAGDVTLGPVVRFLHVLSLEPSDGPDTFTLSAGLELLLNDAR